MVDEPLIVKYRPLEFNELIGHEDILSGLQRAMASPSHPHAYLLTGPKGTGKTTIARLISRHFSTQLIEIDAATHSKVEEMRQLVEEGMHMSLIGDGRKMYLIDECHRLSVNAFDAMLKTLEEPPAHLYITLCTTDARKIPETILSRCYQMHLRPVKRADMNVLLDAIAHAEGWKVIGDVMAAVIEAAEGSPRMGITLLQSVHSSTDRSEVRRIMSLIDADSALVALIQLLLRGKCTWKVAKQHLSMIEDDAYDQAIVQAGRYICGAMLRADNELEAERAWTLLEALTFPANSFDRKVLLYATIGKLIWGNK